MLKTFIGYDANWSKKIFPDAYKYFVNIMNITLYLCLTIMLNTCHMYEIMLIIYSANNV